MTVISVVMHDHKWEPVPEESGWLTCRCGFFRVLRQENGQRNYVEPERFELLELHIRIQGRLRLRQRKAARDAGIYLPEPEEWK